MPEPPISHLTGAATTKPGDEPAQLLVTPDGRLVVTVSDGPNGVTVAVQAGVGREADGSAQEVLTLVVTADRGEHGTEFLGQLITGRPT